MGNCSSESNPDRLQFVDMVKFTYNQPETQKHPLLGNVEVYQNKRTLQPVAIFNYPAQQNESEVAQALERIKNTDREKHPSLVPMLMYKNFAYSDQGQGADLVAMYEFLPNTLLSEFKKRKSAGKGFDQGELIALVKAVTGAARCKQNKYGALRLNSVLVKGQNFYLLHPDTPELRSNLQLLEHGLEEEGMYPSPEELGQAESERSWVFSLGMMMLSLGIGQSLNPAYGGGSLRMEVVESKLKMFNKQYSIGLYQLVEECVRPKVEQRPSLQRIEEYAYHKLISLGVKAERVPEEMSQREKRLLASSSAMKNYIAEAMSVPTSNKYSSRVFKSTIARSKIYN